MVQRSNVKSSAKKNRLKIGKMQGTPWTFLFFKKKLAQKLLWEFFIFFTIG